MILTYFVLCARCSEIQRRLRMEKQKRASKLVLIYPRSP